MANVKVIYAVYGALHKGNENDAKAALVTTALQQQIDANDGIVTIDNTSMGGDPSQGDGKHFGALIERDGQQLAYACAEGQTVDFMHHGTNTQ